MLSKDLLEELYIPENIRMPWEKELDFAVRKLKWDLIMDEINEAKKEKERKRKHLYNLKKNKFKRRQR